MKRPYFKVSIAELEAALASRGDDAAFLGTLLEELNHRTTLRAGRLRQRVQQLIAGSERATRSSGIPVTEEDREEALHTDGDPLPPPQPSTGLNAGPRPQYPPISDNPERILSSWI